MKQLIFLILLLIGSDATAQAPNETLIRNLIKEFAKEGKPASAAINKLTQIGVPAVPFLAQALQDPNVYTRAAAATTLSQIGPPAKPAIPALIKATKDKNKFVRLRSVMALGRCGAVSASAQVAYLEALKDKDPDVQVFAALGVGLVGKSSPEALDALELAQRDEDLPVAQISTKVIGDLDPPTERAVRLLMRAATHVSEAVRLAAVQGLGKQGKFAEIAIPTLIIALKDKQWTIRASAALVLGDLRTSRGEEVCPALRAVKGDKVELVREAADMAHSKVCGGFS